MSPQNNDNDNNTKSWKLQAKIQYKMKLSGTQDDVEERKRKKTEYAKW